MARLILTLAAICLLSYSGAGAQEILVAAQVGDLERVQAAVTVDPSRVELRGAYDKTPLIFAAQGGHVEIAGYLIDQGADLNQGNVRNETPLLYGVYFGHFEVVELLLDRGADPNILSSDGDSPLDMAVMLEQDRICSLLRSRGALETEMPPAEVEGLGEDLLRIAYPYAQAPNTVACTDSEGLLLVDTGWLRGMPALRQTLGRRDGREVAVIINTHQHPDHCEGNAIASSQTQVIALPDLQELVADGIVERDHGPWVARDGHSFPETFTFRHGGQVIRLVPVPGIHTDGDMLVYFTGANVVHMGDLLILQSFPSVTREVDQYLEFLDTVCAIFPADATLVCGHGPGGTIADARAYRDMLADVRSQVDLWLDEGRTQGEILDDESLERYAAYGEAIAELSVDYWIRAVCWNREHFGLPELQSDFDQCTKAIWSDHPRTFTDEAELKQAVATQRALLVEGMTAEEFYRVLAPAVARVRCGHTRTGLPLARLDDLKQEATCLPLDVRILGDELYVNHAFAGGPRVPRGAEILAIDGYETGTIVATLLAGLPADGGNQTYKRSAMNHRFARLFAAFFGSAPRFELTLAVTGEATPVKVLVPALSLAEVDSLTAVATGAADRPRWSSRIDTDQDYGYLQIGDFSYYEDPAVFNDPVGELFVGLQQQSIGTLILDLRGNDGGDPFCSSFVARHLLDPGVPYFAADTPYYTDLVVAQPVPDSVFRGELFVLIDGETFSSSTHLSALLRHHGRGVFIGEETGGCYVCNDASQTHVLEHTKVRVNVPRMAFAVAVQGMELGRGIRPDVAITPKIDDLVAGRDVVLEAAMQRIGSTGVSADN